jgi:hypothetical protein
MGSCGTATVALGDSPMPIFTTTDLCLPPSHLCSVQEDYRYTCCGVYPQQSSVTTAIKSYQWRATQAPHPKDIIW